jgi:flotillin
LLSVSAFKPIIDKILAEAGFAAGPDALASLTNALAAQQLANSAKPVSATNDVSTLPAHVITAPAGTTPDKPAATRS